MKIKTSISYHDTNTYQYSYICSLPKHQRSKYIHKLILNAQEKLRLANQLKDHACLFSLISKDLVISKSKTYTIKCDSVELTFNARKYRAKNADFHLLYTKSDATNDLDKMLNLNNLNLNQYSLDRGDHFEALNHVYYIKHIERIKLINAKLLADHHTLAVNIPDGIYSIYQFGNDLIFNKLD